MKKNILKLSNTELDGFVFFEHVLLCNDFTVILFMYM